MRRSIGVAALAAGSAVIAALAKQHGVFRSVEWTDEELEGFRMAYIEHIGPYNDIGRVFHALTKELKSRGLDVSRERCVFAGIYYDDPATTPASQCKSRAGVLLSEEGLAKCGLPVMEVESQKALRTEFPYISWASVFVAIAKAYPALKKACAETPSMTIEVYDKVQHRIIYYALTSAG